MKQISQALALLLLLILSASSCNDSQDAAVEWDILMEEAESLYQQGQYDRAVVVAKKALEAAEENVSPNHPDVEPWPNYSGNVSFSTIL